MMKQLAIDEAEADAWDNAQEVNRLRKTVALLRTRIKRQDRRRWTGWHEDHLWWAGENTDFDHTNDEEHPR